MRFTKGRIFFFVLVFAFVCLVVFHRLLATQIFFMRGHRGGELIAARTDPNIFEITLVKGSPVDVRATLRCQNGRSFFIDLPLRSATPPKTLLSIPGIVVRRGSYLLDYEPKGTLDFSTFEDKSCYSGPSLSAPVSVAFIVVESGIIEGLLGSVIGVIAGHRIYRRLVLPRSRGFALKGADALEVDGAAEPTFAYWLTWVTKLSRGEKRFILLTVFAIPSAFIVGGMAAAISSELNSGPAYFAIVASAAVGCVGAAIVGFWLYRHMGKLQPLAKTFRR